MDQVKNDQETLNEKLKELSSLFEREGEEGGVFFESALKKLFSPTFPSNIEALREIDRFYDKIGGLAGYYAQVLRLLLNRKAATPLVLSRPPGFELDGKEGVIEGIEALASMGEMYPIGGLATRLDLRDTSGKSLPAAVLPFYGHSLLEGLIRDVQGKEALYERLVKKPITLPIALMLSDENTDAVHELLEQHNWFGRPRDSIRLFHQPSVPVIDCEGKWVMEDDQVLLQPGGHGAIWQSALQGGVFDWFCEKGIEHLLIRQINNPLGGIDHALLSLVGLGARENKTFGFLSCERDPKVSEGVLALIEEEKRYRIGNIEYTQVADYGVEEATHLTANTNILYVNVKRLLPTLHKRPLCGFMLNMKQTFDGEKVAGRLESMMQSMSEELVSEDPAQLESFIALQQRSKTIASTKRKFTGTLLETPEGAFYQFLVNHYGLLQKCGFDLPPLCSGEEYLMDGPSFLFYYHPRLGPLYSLIEKKLRGGKLARGAELMIEPSDVYIEQLQLKGSLLIEGEGKCVLKQVAVENKGVNEGAQNYWRCDYTRAEALAIIVHKGGEFHAEGVELKGSQLFEVPAGERWVLSSRGLVKKPLERPTWQWNYLTDEAGNVSCKLV